MLISSHLMESHQEKGQLCPDSIIWHNLAHNEIPHLVSLLATSQCKRMDQRLAGQVTFRFPVKNLNFQFYNQINLVFSVEKNSIGH